MREFELLEQIFASNKSLGPDVMIKPGDDMAMIRVGDANVLAAVDQVVEGRHFLLDATPLELIGRKAVTRCLSDVAAMAVRPVASLAAVTLPRDFDSLRANILFEAVRSTAQNLECPLIGGDVAIHRDSSSPLMITVTVLASPGPTEPVTRTGAKPGDSVFVTGYLGGSVEADGGGRHLTFEPRIAEALALADELGFRLHAMIDLSDGLGRDAGHIAKCSEVQIVLDSQHIPCHTGLDWKRAVSDGEDYELCFTAEGDVPTEILNLTVTKVGTVQKHTQGEPFVLILAGDRMIPADDMGWEHSDGGE